MKARVRLGKKELFAFLFYHMYFRPMGIVYGLIGLLALGGGIYYLVQGNKSGIFLLIICGVYFVIQPVMLLVRAVQQSKNPQFAVDTLYEFSEEGITVYQQEDDKASLPWENVSRFVKFSKYYFIYVDAAHGNILPKDAFSSDTAALDTLVVKMLPKERRRGFGK